MAPQTVIDGLLERTRELIAFLRERGELSLALDAETNFKKLLLMACGSFFEDQITGFLEAFSSQGSDVRLSTFIRNKALKRQYHTLFTWDAQNANAFLGLFGDEFKKTVQSKLQSDESLVVGMKAFLRIGERRNRLVHGNIASVPVDETMDEIAAHYSQAWHFVRFLACEFGERCRADTPCPANLSDPLG